MEYLKNEEIFKSKISRLVGKELCGMDAMGFNLEMGRSSININEQQLLLRLRGDSLLEETVVFFWENENKYGRTFYYLDIGETNQPTNLFNSQQEQFDAISKNIFKSSIHFPKTFVVESISIYGEHKEVLVNDEWSLDYYFEKKIIDSPIVFSYLIDTINAMVFKYGDTHILINAFRGSSVLYGTKEEIENELYYLDDNDEKQKLKHYFDI